MRVIVAVFLMFIFSSCSFGVIQLKSCDTTAMDVNATELDAPSKKSKKFMRKQKRARRRLYRRLRRGW